MAGSLPSENTVADGWRTTSPVGIFGKTSGGLTDMGGNVWQWCDDWYRPYAARDAAFTPGPKSEKVIRGGSFLCDPKVCHGFRVSARGHEAPDTGLVHVGFRCAMSISSGTTSFRSLEVGGFTVAECSITSPNGDMGASILPFRGFSAVQGFLRQLLPRRPCLRPATPASRAERRSGGVRSLGAHPFPRFDFPPTDGRMSHRVPDRRDSIDITGFEGCGRRSATRSG
jgi:hypothetical protein